MVAMAVKGGGAKGRGKTVKMGALSLLKAPSRLRRKMFERSAANYEMKIGEKILAALHSVNGVMDEDIRIKHPGKVTLLDMRRVEGCCVDLAAAVCNADAILEKQRFPTWGEAIRSVRSETKLLEAKRRELKKEYGTTVRGFGKKYYLEFLVDEHIDALIKEAGEKRKAILQKFLPGGD